MVASPVPRASPSVPLPVISLVPPKSSLGSSGCSHSLAASYHHYCISSSSPGPHQRVGAIHFAAQGSHQQPRLGVVDLRGGGKTAPGWKGQNSGDNSGSSSSCSRASTSISPPPLQLSQSMHVSSGTNMSSQDNQRCSSGLIRGEDVAVCLADRCTPDNRMSVKGYADDQGRSSRHRANHELSSLDLSHEMRGILLSGSSRGSFNGVSTQQHVPPNTASHPQLSAPQSNRAAAQNGGVPEQGQGASAESLLSSLSSSPATAQAVFSHVRQGHGKVLDDKASLMRGKQTGNSDQIKSIKRTNDHHETSELAVAAAVMLLKQQQDMCGRHNGEGERERGDSKDGRHSSLYPDELRKSGECPPVSVAVACMGPQQKTWDCLPCIRGARSLLRDYSGQLVCGVSVSAALCWFLQMKVFSRAPTSHAWRVWMSAACYRARGRLRVSHMKQSVTTVFIGSHVRFVVLM